MAMSTWRTLHPARLVRALASNSSGSAVVELAFIVPAVLLFVIGAMEVGRVMWLQNALNYSVLGAARCMSNAPATCDTTADTQSYAAGLAGAGFTSSNFTVTTASCGNQVTASYPVTLLIPYVSVSTTLTSQVCYPT